MSWSKVQDKLHLVPGYQLHIHTYFTKHARSEQPANPNAAKKCPSRNSRVPTSENWKFCYSCLTVLQPNLQSVRSAASSELEQQFRFLPAQRSQCPLCKERLPKPKPRTTSFTQTAPPATLLQRPEEQTYSNLGRN